VTDGVCLVSIADKAAISQPAASKHMEFRVEAVVVVATPISRWTFYGATRPPSGRRRTLAGTGLP
jgi:hypothetical protein